MNDIYYDSGQIIIKNVENFNLEQTLDCGQAFRWRRNDNGVWCGIAGGKYIEMHEKDGNIIAEKTNQADFEGFWIEYFDLKRNYSSIIADFLQN